jgi:hypothetical protein
MGRDEIRTTVAGGRVRQQDARVQRCGGTIPAWPGGIGWRICMWSQCRLCSSTEPAFRSLLTMPRSSAGVRGGISACSLSPPPQGVPIWLSPRVPRSAIACGIAARRRMRLRFLAPIVGPTPQMPVPTPYPGGSAATPGTWVWPAVVSNADLEAPKPHRPSRTSVRVLRTEMASGSVLSSITVGLLAASALAKAGAKSAVASMV